VSDLYHTGNKNWLLFNCLWYCHREIKKPLSSWTKRGCGQPYSSYRYKQRKENYSRWSNKRQTSIKN